MVWKSLVEGWDVIFLTVQAKPRSIRPDVTKWDVETHPIPPLVEDKRAAKYRNAYPKLVKIIAHGAESNGTMMSQAFHLVWLAEARVFPCVDNSALSPSF